MSDKDDYITINWMYDKRSKWLRNAMNIKSLTVNDFAFFGLIPWHTKSKSEITNYVNANIHQIIEFVIKPTSKLSNQLTYSELKNKIIARGSLLLDIVNSNRELQKIITFQVEYVAIN